VPDQQERDQQILRADALGERVKNASLGEFVEWLTALAMCFRRTVVDGGSLEPAIARIALELMEGIDQGLPESLTGDDAEERRRQHARFDTYLAALKPRDIADFMDEMAEGFRAVLLYNDFDRLHRLIRCVSGDVALVCSRLVRDLVKKDIHGGLSFEPVEEDMLLMANSASAAAT